MDPYVELNGSDHDERTVIISDPALKQFDGGFTAIPNRILENSDLSIGARMTYAMLLKYAWQKNFCHPAQRTLAADLGLKDRMVRYHLDELRSAELIRWQRQGFKGPNKYYILRLPARAAGSVTPNRQHIATPIGDRQHIAGRDRQYTAQEEDSENKTHSTGTGTGDEQVGEDEERVRVELLVREMLETLHDRESKALYRLIAERLPEELVYQALSETREQTASGRIRKRGAYFVAIARRLAARQGIELGIGSPQ